MGDDSHGKPAEQEDLDHLIAEYQQRVGLGEQVDLEAFLAPHPGLANAFRRYLADQASTRGAAAHEPSSANEAGPGTQARTEADTLAPQSKAATAAETSALPEKLGRYRILRLLGHGAMGAVYLAEDSELRRQVALKVPKFGEHEEADLKERFYREARSAATLHHPNICPVYDIGEDQGTRYIAMAYLSGPRLSALVGTDKLRSERTIVKMVRRIALALAEAHAKGIVHRDLKPGNIVLDEHNEPVVTDFGLARQVEQEGEARLTQDGVLLGTPAYMAPEQVGGVSERIGPACDVYALGVILYELLTGRLPYLGPIAAVLGQIIQGKPKRPSELRPDLDKRLEAICLKLMASAREKRYASAAEAATALGKWLEQGSVGQAASPPGNVAQAASLPPQVLRQGPTAVAEAIKLLAAQEYAQAIERLESLPEESRPPEAAMVLQQARAMKEEVDRLNARMQQAVREHRYDGLRDVLERLLTLTPGNLTARDLFEKLASYGPNEPLRFAKDGSLLYSHRHGRWLDRLARLIYQRLTRPRPASPLTPRVATKSGGKSQAARSAEPSVVLSPPFLLTAGLLLALLGGAYYLGVVVLRAKDKEGKVVAEVKVPEGGTGEILRDGKVVAKEEAPKEKSSGLADTVGAPPRAVAPFDGPTARRHQEAWGRYLGVPVEISNSIGMKFVLVPPGEFDMGSTTQEVTRFLEEARSEAKSKEGLTWLTPRLRAEAPRHRVRITKPFYLGLCEVTQAEYGRVMGKSPSKFPGEPTRPVEQVSWDEAAEFCRKLGELPEEQAARAVYRFPAEAEWEYACRAGTTTKWYCGSDDAALKENAWYRDNAGGTTHPVRQKTPNAWGLYDMHGNVWEWCQDWHADYGASPVDDPTGPSSGSGRVIRGGCFDYDASGSRAASRWDWPYGRHFALGFRVARAVSSAKTVSAPAAGQTVSDTLPKELSLDLGNGVKAELVLIPAGTFTMGSPDNEPGRDAGREGPLHEVTITKPFYMGKYEVTVEQFRRFVRSTNYATEAEQAGNKGRSWDNGIKELTNVNWKQPNFPQEDNHPVCLITWKDAQAFVSWARDATGKTVRLPTEAEWEYACRAGTTTRFNLGDQDQDLDRAGWFEGNSGHKTHPVGRKTPNAWSLYDMHGNVWEWCADWAQKDYYKLSPRTDPPGPTVADDRLDRLVRGGSWTDPPANCRSARRGLIGASPRFAMHGFRLAVDARVGALRARSADAAVDAPERWKNAVDILSLVDPVADAVKGAWARKGSELITPNIERGILEFPYRPPAEYDFRLAFTRDEGTGDVCQGLAKGGHSFKWAMGLGSASGPESAIFGFDNVAGQGARFNPTKRVLTPGIENKRRYVSVVQVRNDGPKAYLDGKLITEWKTDYSDLSPFSGTRFRDETLLGLTTFRGAVTVHEAQVLEVTGRGTFTRPDDPAAKEAERKRSGTPGQAGSDALPKELSLDLAPGVKMEFVLVPPGEFDMGSNDGLATEKPVHKVRISKPFYVAKYESTVAQFRAFADAANYQTEAEKGGKVDWGVKDGKWQRDVKGLNWRNPGFQQTPAHPAAAITWNDAQEFCKWASRVAAPSGATLGPQDRVNFRLPTEAEWEYAARGPRSAKYPWGDQWDGLRANHRDAALRDSGFQDPGCSIDNDWFAYTAPVGTYRTGASWCGAYDMTGNVWEWVGDFFDPGYYQRSPAVDPKGPDAATDRIHRGGAFTNMPEHSRSAIRVASPPGNRTTSNGFRCALDPPSKTP